MTRLEQAWARLRAAISAGADPSPVLLEYYEAVRADERERCAKELEERADLICRENCYCEECATWRDAAIRLRGLK